MDGLAMALWSFYHTKTYAEAIVRCMNFLGDADTTSAICGQIAGAFYGYEAILREWRKDLQKWDDLDIACRGALLWALQEARHTKDGGEWSEPAVKKTTLG
jgi:ADP-ribosylglycohydrolase